MSLMGLHNVYKIDDVIDKRFFPSNTENVYILGHADDNFFFCFWSTKIFPNKEFSHVQNSVDLDALLEPEGSSERKKI